MTTTVSKISTLPIPPSTSNPENFSERADTFFSALPTFVTQFNGSVDLINTSTIEAYDSAQQAAISASAAAAASNAALWNSATVYTQGQVVYSPLTYQTYRRNASGLGSAYAQDPSLDTLHWAILTNGDVNLITDSSVSTLNNKTLNNPLLIAQKESFSELTYSSTISLNTSTHSVFKVTLAGTSNITFTAPHLAVNEVATCIVEIVNPTPGYLVTWGGSGVVVKWPYGIPPQLTTNGTDIFGFTTYTQGTTWIGNPIALGVA